MKTTGETATAGKGKVSDIRKVTNSISAQSEVREISTGRTFSLFPWHGTSAKARVDFEDAV